MSRVFAPTESGSHVAASARPFLRPPRLQTPARTKNTDRFFFTVATRCASDSEASASDAPAKATVAEDVSAASDTKDLQGGRMLYNPESYEVLVKDATNAVLKALDAGETRLEVEFPPPGGENSYKSSSEDSIDANIQLALAGATQLAEAGRKVRVLLADSVELGVAEKKYTYKLEVTDNVAFGHTREGMPALEWMRERKIPPESTEADTYIVISHSTVELPSIEAYAKEIVGDKPLILWNLQLDTLRADLGLFGFPGQDVQFRFLSQFRPVFYLRQRDYSKSIAVVPFLVNYSGALFREYPGPWQVMLKQDDASYACIAEDGVRFTLYDVKEELLEAMGLNTEEEGSTMAFLRRGYKRSTWWEDAVAEEESTRWRT
ncbi:hypothetical protein BSKO_07710 [Bryopsis sp. KO-2023]|nr:hypothetical protein BSKO_07710 [Bryopsis sp. KO-2023]